MPGVKKAMLHPENLSLPLGTSKLGVEVIAPKVGLCSMAVFESVSVGETHS